MRTLSAYPSGALMPVPMAVAPRFISRSRLRDSWIRSMSSPMVTAWVRNSWPRVMGTASCSWVLPILMISLNSTAFWAKACVTSAMAMVRSSSLV